MASPARAVYWTSTWPASFIYTSPKVRSNSRNATSTERLTSDTSSPPNMIREPEPAPPFISRASSMLTISVFVAFTASSAAIICGPAPVREPKIPMDRYDLVSFIASNT